MNRLQKKCVIASTGFHLLLMVILFIGPAFLASRDKADNMPVLDFVPMKTIDAAFSGGGNPNAKPPPPAPQPQPPAPQPQAAPPAPQPQPQPVKEIVRSPEPSLEPAENKVHKPQVSPKPVTRPRTTTTASSDSDADARETAKRREAYSSAIRNLRGGLSSKTSVEDIYGPGGGGPTYANFFQAVRAIYFDAWIVPDGVTDNEAAATASVTIARDGTVLNARILHPSGNTLADQSVEIVLRRVKFAVPLPDDAKENQRTITIKFSVKAKRGLG
jgi:periplasmic protein TonB